MTYKKFQKAGNARHLLTPYKNLYTRMCRTAAQKDLPVTLTYKQYVNIIKHNPNCVYCGRKLKWVKHGQKAFHVNLDRRNNNSGYNIRNVVASCHTCNMARADRYDHKTWYAMTEVLRNKRGLR